VISTWINLFTAGLLCGVLLSATVVWRQRRLARHGTRRPARADRPEF
jgi:hypothetical protein